MRSSQFVKICECGCSTHVDVFGKLPLPWYEVVWWLPRGWLPLSWRTWLACVKTLVHEVYQGKNCLTSKQMKPFLKVDALPSPRGCFSTTSCMWIPGGRKRVLMRGPGGRLVVLSLSPCSTCSHVCQYISMFVDVCQYMNVTLRESFHHVCLF